MSENLLPVIMGAYCFLIELFLQMFFLSAFAPHVQRLNACIFIWIYQIYWDLPSTNYKTKAEAKTKLIAKIRRKQA